MEKDKFICILATKEELEKLGFKFDNRKTSYKQIEEELKIILSIPKKYYLSAFETPIYGDDDEVVIDFCTNKAFSL
jgi:hypothetical protein